jgi:catechol 2,3-dioxygenase-like lactoylglutathione lyase family enzyme
VSDLTTHHVGTTVSNLDRAVDFYRDVLGLDVLSEFESTGESFATGVGVPNATGKFAHLDAGGARVELIEYEPAGEPCTAESVNQRGAKHLGFEVDDVDAFYADLPDDVETLSEPQTTPTGAQILFIRDPEDNLIEIITP